MKLITYIQYILQEQDNYIKLTKNGIRHEEVIYLMNKFDSEGQLNVQKDTHQLLLNYFSNGENYHKYDHYIKELLLLSGVLAYRPTIDYLKDIYKELHTTLHIETLNLLENILHVKTYH